MAQATRVVVDYTYGREGGSKTRSRLGTSTTNLSHPMARSETAVLAYLRKRHPGLDITILSIDFQNASGRTV